MKRTGQDVIKFSFKAGGKSTSEQEWALAELGYSYFKSGVSAEGCTYL